MKERRRTSLLIPLGFREGRGSGAITPPTLPGLAIRHELHRLPTTHKGWHPDPSVEVEYFRRYFLNNFCARTERIAPHGDAAANLPQAHHAGYGQHRMEHVG